MVTAAETLTIDELARQVSLPVRTIREYHTMRLLPAAGKRGRVGLYGPQHVQRLQLIARLQRRGYSLAGIRDLLAAWETGTDLTTLLGIGQGEAALDEVPLRLSRAELAARLPALDDASLEQAGRSGLAYPVGGGYFLVRSPALLSLAADWVAAGLPLADALAVIQTLTGDVGIMAGNLARLLADPVRTSAAGRDLAGLLRRGRPLLLQGVASVLADRLGAALADRAEATGDHELLAALAEVRVGAVTDSAGTIRRAPATATGRDQRSATE